MGNFRFYRRVRIFPGLAVNLSKSGPSVTLGMRGAHVTLGSTGIRKTFDIPGSGLYYTSHQGYHSGLHSAHVETPITEAQQNRAHGAAMVIMIVAALVIGVAIGAAYVHS